MISAFSELTKAQETEKTCNVWQVCNSNKDATPDNPPQYPCLDGADVTVPVFIEGNYAPTPMNSLGQANLQTACPFYTDPDEPLCCNSDTAEIMVHNFQQLDGVFNTDCPVCAANLKRMWCEYACDSKKTSWNLHMGDSPGIDVDFNFTNIQVSIDDAYACTIYSSCKGTSFIAAAGVSSSVAFLNFLGYNGAPYSLSYINFTTDTGVTPGQLNSEAVPCQDPVPSDGLLFGYDKVTNSTCSFCQKACPPPIVSDNIGFLDGFSWKLVGWSYLGFVLFTILFQVVSHCYLKKRKLAAAQAAIMVNQTASTQAQTSRNTSRMTQQGRPVNMSENTSLDMNRRTNLSQNSGDLSQ